MEHAEFIAILDERCRAAEAKTQRLLEQACGAIQAQIDARREEFNNKVRENPVKKLKECELYMQEFLTGLRESSCEENIKKCERALQNILRTMQHVQQTDYSAMAHRMGLEYFRNEALKADMALGIKIDQDYENINYRFKPTAYLSNVSELKHITEAERCGLLMDKSNGGEFLPGAHKEIYKVLQECLEGHSDKAGKKLRFEGGQVIQFSDHNYRAFDAWGESSREEKIELGMPDFESFAIKVMNAGKIGSVSNIKVRGIATSDTMPLRRFRPWLLDRYVIAPVRGYQFEKKGKLFLPRVQSNADKQSEEMVKLDLRDELGKDTDFYI